MRCPNILSCEELFNQFLVVICLILLGVVALRGVGGVPIQRLTAVFAHPHGDIRKFGVEFVKPRAVHGGVAAVPAKIVVERQHIGHLQIFVVNIAHGNHRHRS